ncbi:MAG TPA: PHP domain-containing protein, partial [Sphingomonadaceae bacterium]|nr:PHP domain-containing protein [Sphingomonadaceae bacterium]
MTAFAELVAASNFSFLRGAAHPAELVARAIALGQAGIGIADRNSVAGVVRAHAALRDAREAGAVEAPFTLAAGARLVFADGTPEIVAYPADRAGWGRLCRLLTLGKRRAGKGACTLHLADLLDHAEGLLLIVMPPESEEEAAPALARLAAARPGAVWLGATMRYRGDDRRRLARLARLAGAAGVPLLATNDVLYDVPARRPLQDVLTCIREKSTLDEAGRRLEANAERHLKPPAEMARLFRDAPEAVAESTRLLARIAFSLDQLRYEYPHEPVPPGWSPQDWLEELVRRRLPLRYPEGAPPKVVAL